MKKKIKKQSQRQEYYPLPSSEREVFMKASSKRILMILGVVMGIALLFTGVVYYQEIKKATDKNIEK